MSSNISNNISAMDSVFNDNSGIVRLAPAWVPRAFCTPGRRIRLHPDDYYILGVGRGGIDERWLSSAVRADNGPKTGPFEGLSLVVGSSGELIPFDDFVGHHKANLIGQRLWDKHQKWPMYSKFFDNEQALPFHVHHRDEHAALINKPGKPEAYYYSPHMNNHLGKQPISFFGLQPTVTPEQFKERLGRFSGGGDNRITDLSLGYTTQLGTGWDIPGGVLHAPASICTYEPQAACDVFAMCESWSNNQEVSEELLWKDVPTDRKGDLNFIIEVLDWEKNTDPEFGKNRFMAPISTKKSLEDGETEYVEKWIIYKSTYFSAKELTIKPNSTVTITDTDAYGLIVVQGSGLIDKQQLLSSTTIRYGELTHDEYFVSDVAAKRGVRFQNLSTTTDMVILKHFGPNNSELALNDK